MARKKKEEVVLTEEQKFEKEKKRYIADMEEKLPYLTEPTYFFKVGDHVHYGAMQDAEVIEVLFDNKAYVLRCTAKRENYGHPYDEICCRVASWVDTRPIIIGDSDFTKNEDIHLYFNNSTIESVIFKHYGFGVDMSPEYQRDFVWSMEDKIYLLDSIFNNIDIGKFVFIHRTFSDWYNTGYSYEILDGKQRLSTIIEFYENRFPYKGKYFNELSFKDRRTFLQLSVAVAEVSDADKKSIYQYFLMLNRCGKVMEKQQLDKVSKLLEEL